MKAIINIAKYFITWIKQFRIHRQFDLDYSFAKSLLNKMELPELTKDEISDITAYWGRKGIIFPDYTWFQLFYGITQIHSPLFIPQPIAYAVIQKGNNQEMIPGWDDKNIYEILIPTVVFPNTYCHYIHNVYYDKDWNIIDTKSKGLNNIAEIIIKCCRKDNSFILKRTSNTGCGRGVRKFVFKDKADIIDILQSLPSNEDYIIQESIRQHSMLAKFNKSSVNILRVLTYRCEENIEVLSVSFRFGIDGQYTDVAFKDGQEIVNVVGVDIEKGIFKNKLFDTNGEKPYTLPDGVNGEKIPGLEKVIEMAKSGHKRLFHFNFVGWDFTIDEFEQPICIEYNIKSPGVMLYQFANGPLAGALTDKFLEALSDKQVRRQIPRHFRCS